MSPSSSLPFAAALPMSASSFSGEREPTSDLGLAAQRQFIQSSDGGVAPINHATVVPRGVRQPSSEAFSPQQPRGGDCVAKSIQFSSRAGASQPARYWADRPLGGRLFFIPES